MKWMKLTLVVANIVLYFLVIAMWLAIPFQTTLNLSTTLFNLGLTGVVIFLYRDYFSVLYRSQWFQKFSQTFISAVLIFFILGLLNYLAFKHPVAIDLTENRLFTLSKTSYDVIARISDKLTFKVFSRKNEFPPIRTLLDLYRVSGRGITIEFVDLDLRPDLVSQYEVDRSGTVVIEYQGRRHSFLAKNELGVTNALSKILRKSDPLIHFSTGHNEYDVEETSKEGLSQLAKKLSDGYYQMKKLALNMTEKLPDDLEVLAIIGPKKAFTDKEVKMISNFLGEGGKLFLAIDPNINGDLFQNIRQLLQSYQIDLRNNLVVDQESSVSGSKGSAPLVNKFDPKHPMTKNFHGQVFFPLASSVFKLESNVEKGIFSSIAATGPFPASWADNNPKEILKGKLKFTQGKDFPGPIPLMVSWEEVSADKKEKRARIVAAGNASFALNSYAPYSSNLELMISALGWLATKGELTSLNLPVIEERPVFINTHQLGVIFYFSVIFLPLIMFSLALLVFLRRRKL